MTSRFKLHHALVCSINGIAITHAYKQVQLAAKTSIFSLFLPRAQTGLSRLKGLLFEDKYRGAKDRAELEGYIGEPLIRSTVDTLNDGRKYCLLIYNSY